MELAMNRPIDRKQPEEAFLEALAAELAEMSNYEVLEGVDPDRMQKFGKSILESAKKETGRRRLQRAQAARAAKRAIPASEQPSVSASEARSYLAKAANDSRFTLAARELDEMSDEDVIRLYQQAKQLNSSDEG
jgi:hypothetical protein